MENLTPEQEESMLAELGVVDDNITTSEESAVTDEDTSKTVETGEEPTEDDDTDESSESEKKIEKALKKKYLKTISKLSKELEDMKGRYDESTFDDLVTIKEATKKELREEMQLEALQASDSELDMEDFTKFRDNTP